MHTHTMRSAYETSKCQSVDYAEAIESGFSHLMNLFAVMIELVTKLTGDMDALFAVNRADRKTAACAHAQRIISRTAQHSDEF